MLNPAVRIKWKLWALLPSVLLALALATPDEWPPAGARIFSSELGRRGLTVIAKLKPEEDLRREQAKESAEERELFSVSATMFTLDSSGQQNTLWKKALSYIPHCMLISDFGHSVAIDEYAHLGYNHALVIFDLEGNVLADYRLEDLLTDAEIKDHALRTVSSRIWYLDAQHKFVPSQGLFYLRLKWGKVVTADLRTGTLWPGFDPAAYKTDDDFEKAVEKYRRTHGVSKAPRAAQANPSTQAGQSNASARAIAVDIAKESGYDVDSYVAESRRVDRKYWVMFRMRPRMGLILGDGDPYHFTVIVADDGSAVLHRGQ